MRKKAMSSSYICRSYSEKLIPLITNMLKILFYFKKNLPDVQTPTKGSMSKGHQVCKLLQQTLPQDVELGLFQLPERGSYQIMRTGTLKQIKKIMITTSSHYLEVGLP